MAEERRQLKARELECKARLLAIQADAAKQPLKRQILQAESALLALRAEAMASERADIDGIRSRSHQKGLCA